MRRTALGACVSLAMLLVTAQAGLGADSSVAGATNIAAAENGGQLIAASEQAKNKDGHILENWQAANAIDGLYVVGSHTPPNSYGWSTETPPTVERPHWIILAFGPKARTHLISRVVIDPTTDDPPYIGRWVRNIQIQVSTTESAGPYKTVGRYMVVNRPIKQAFDFPPVECRYLRVLLLDNHGSDKCVEVGEIEVYEAIVGQDQLDRLILRLENLLQDLKRYRDAQSYQSQKNTLEAVTAKEAPPQPIPDTGG